MKKFACSEDLTGGTRMVNPRYLRLFVQQTGAAFTVQRFPTNVAANIDNENGIVHVMEVLKVKWELQDPPTIQNSVAFEIAGGLTYNNTTGEPNLLTPSTISVRKIWGSALVSTQSYAALLEGVWVDDLTDGAGHGWLVAAEDLFVTASTTNYASNVRWNVLLEFRWKAVPMMEYIALKESAEE